MKPIVYKILIGFLLVAGFLFFAAKLIAPEDLKKVLLEFPKEQLILFLALSFIISALKALRLLILLRGSRIDINFRDTLKAFLASQTTTPFPGGEAFRGVLIREETKGPLITTAAPVATQALLEPLTAALILILGSFYFEDLRVTALVTLIFFGLVLWTLIDKRLLEFLYKLLPEKKLTDKIFKNLFFVQKAIKSLTLKQRETFFKVISLSLIAHLLGGILVFLIARSYSLDLDILKSIVVYSSSVVITTLAVVSPGGLGFTEGGMTGLLLVFGVDLPKALAVVLTFRVVTLIFSIFLGLIFLLIFYSKSFFKPIFKFMGGLL